MANKKLFFVYHNGEIVIPSLSLLLRAGIAHQCSTLMYLHKQVLCVLVRHNFYFPI